MGSEMCIRDRCSVLEADWLEELISCALLSIAGRRLVLGKMIQVMVFWVVARERNRACQRALWHSLAGPRYRRRKAQVRRPVSRTVVSRFPRNCWIHLVWDPFFWLVPGLGATNRLKSAPVSRIRKPCFDWRGPQFRGQSSVLWVHSLRSSCCCTLGLAARKRS